MHIVSIVGARPQFVKLAPIARIFQNQSDITHSIIHTGQHYDASMSQAFFTGLGIPAPNVSLEIGSGSHGVQTGRILAELDPVLTRLRPDIVLVYGDTNSTLAGAIAAVKMQIPVAHLEAGLRSFNRVMPEEHNRILTDHASALLLAPTVVAKQHLDREGLGERVQVVGDVMADVLFSTLDTIEHNTPKLPPNIDPDSPYILATIHRAENTDDPERLDTIVKSLQSLPIPVYLLAHPRLLDKARGHSISLDSGSVNVGEPLPYAELILLMKNSAGIVTDSGGLQKESYLLGKLCTTIRMETEWVETLEDGWNVLVTELDKLNTIATRTAPAKRGASHYGDGNTAQIVLESLRAFYNSIS